MKPLRIADTLALPPESITETFAILAMRGAGKSNTAVVLAERMHDAGLPWVAIDPKGDWWGVRSSADGKGPGLPIPVFGGLHGDVPLEPRAGSMVADLVVDKRLTCILDVSEFSKADEIAFLNDFGDRLYRRNRDPLHLFLEECDDYIPERVMREQARSVYLYGKIVKQGRFRGLGCTLITQRTALLNKNVLSQVGTMIAMRTTWPSDKKKILHWMEHHAVSSEIVQSLASLEDGEAWFCSPYWLKRVERARFHRRRTFDSGATPKMGKARPPARLADIDLGAIRDAMAATIERAKADDPRELKKRIAELERELKNKTAGGVDPKAHAALADQVRQLKEALDQVHREATQLAQMLADLGSPIERVAGMVRKLATGARVRQVGEAPYAPSEEHIHVPKTSGVGELVRKGSYPTLQHYVARPADWSAPAGLGPGALKVLTAIAQHAGGVKRDQLSVLAGYKKRSRDTYISRLRGEGLIDLAGDRIVATDAGRAALGPDFEPLPTGAALRDYWMERLPEGERRVLAPILHAHPDEIARDALAVGYKKRSRDTYISRLAARQLITITGPGRVRAADHLF